MNYYLLTTLWILSSFTLTFAQIPIDGKCPTSCKPRFTKVTADQLTGLWYIQNSIPYFYEVGGKCTFTNTTKINDNWLEFEKTIGRKDGTKTVVRGRTQLFSNGTSLNYYTDLNLPMVSQLIAVTPDYIVESACHECGYFQKTGAGRYARIYTRFAFPSCTMVQTAIDIADDCGIPKAYLLPQDFSDCQKC